MAEFNLNAVGFSNLYLIQRAIRHTQTHRAKAEAEKGAKSAGFLLRWMSKIALGMLRADIWMDHHMGGIPNEIQQHHQTT